MIKPMKMAKSKKMLNVSGDTKPDRKLTTRVDQRARRQDVVSKGGEKPSVGDWTPHVATEVLTLMAEVDRLKQELVHSQQKFEELEYIADEDPLVHVLNRRAFDRELTRALAYARRYEMTASFLFIDLNHFKRVNDVYGHGAGDEVLKFVGKTLSENVRSSDVVGRLGGDEFGVILVQADETVSQMKVEDLMSKISAKPVVCEGAEISVSISVGFAMFAPNDDIASLLIRADKAMYQNKNNSRVALAKSDR